MLKKEPFAINDETCSPEEIDELRRRFEPADFDDLRSRFSYKELRVLHECRDGDRRRRRERHGKLFGPFPCPICGWLMGVGEVYCESCGHWFTNGETVVASGVDGLRREGFSEQAIAATLNQISGILQKPEVQAEIQRAFGNGGEPPQETPLIQAMQAQPESETRN